MTKEYLTKESYNIGASLVAQTVKNLPAVQETSVQSLVQEDPLEKEMATHSSIPAWRTGRPQSMASSIESDAEGRSQDGGGLGRGDHFLSYKFKERTIEW